MIDNIKIILLSFNTILLLFMLFKEYTPINNFKHKLWVNKMKKQGKQWHL